MKKKKILSAILLAVFVLAAFGCMAGADRLQKDRGNVTVIEGNIECELGNIYYKQYTPASATAENPAPGVLLLHGYQNDHETCAAYAIELARRGAVVIAIDEFGHGATDIGMIERGYVNHKVTVNYGNDSAADGTYVEKVGGPERYRIMMNFSNLSFFDPHYSEDAEGNSVKDSSMGGIYGYAVLASLPEVDATRLAVSGHSMGTWASWTVSAYYSGVIDENGRDLTPKATVLQCGELFRDSAYDSGKIYFNNVLLLQAQYDEFSYFRDYAPTVTDELLRTPLRTEFLGVDADKAAYDTTFGSFADGSARRIEFLETNHRLTTHNKAGLAVALEWFDSAIGLPNMFDAGSQIAMTKEVLVLCAMLLAIAAMIPFMELLLGTKLFAELAQPLPPKDGIKKGGAWVKGLVITVLIAGATYPFMTQLGHGLLPLPEGVFQMTVGNGFVSWYSLLIIVMIVLTVIARKKAAKAGSDTMTFHAMGLGTADRPDRLSWKLLGLGALMATLMCALMYVMVAICEGVFMLDFRFIWPFFKTFNTERAGQFFVYIPIYCLFYILNNSKIFAGMRSEGTYKEGFAGFLGAWWRYALVMVGGVLLVALIEYIPFFAGFGPGADLLFGSTFGGPFMSLLILFAPQVVVFSIIGTYIYRKTGSVCTGAFTIASLACWIVTGGSSMM